ncbi:Uncharacterized protein APZ42_025189 [Daphnia magna]|uniref:Cc8K15.2-like protein n=1 Tax=Daphnia magna TaxID=35525 RepID=A0A164TCM5_9CRUS|nr:Uncharacterized protein APZ42_025189 [Daphnia magna]
MTNLRSSVKEDSLVGCGSDAAKCLQVCTGAISSDISRTQSNMGESSTSTEKRQKNRDYLVKLYDYWVSVKKTSVATKTKATFPSRAQSHEAFLSHLQQLCNLSANDCYKQLRSSHYRAMKPAAKKRTREESPPSNKKSLTDEEIKILLAIESESESSTDEDGFELNRSHRSITPTTVTLKVPSRKLTAATAQVADRCQLSTRDLLALQSNIISTGGASVNQFSISTSTIKLSSDWDVLGRLGGQVFDTTASNSGINAGCCALIEKEIFRPILWLACRHHMFELHIRHVWEAVSNKPDHPVEPLLKRFQSEWDLLDKSTDDLNLYEWPNKSSALYFFAAEGREWGEKCLEAETFPRKDYRELLELTVVYLGDEKHSSLFRSVMALKLFNTNRPKTFSPGKPIFPVITENVPFLLDLIGERSWLHFDLLQLKGSQDWMQLQPKYWNLMEDYRKARDFVSTLEVFLTYCANLNKIGGFIAPPICGVGAD